MRDASTQTDKVDTIAETEALEEERRKAQEALMAGKQERMSTDRTLVIHKKKKPDEMQKFAIEVAQSALDKPYRKGDKGKAEQIECPPLWVSCAYTGLPCMDCVDPKMPC